MALDNSSPISNLTHKESAQGNSMIVEFEETLKRIDEELGINSETEDLVSIPVLVDAPFEFPMARDSVSHTILAQLVKSDGIAQSIGPIVLPNSVGSPQREKKGNINGPKPQEQGIWVTTCN